MKQLLINQLRYWARYAFLLLTGVLLLPSCDFLDQFPNPASNKAKTYYGDPVTIGNGFVRSFVTLNKAGEPTEIGVRMSESATTGLPPEDTMPPAWYAMNLPAQASAMPFNHLSLDWNAHGHEPEHVYTLPHFDLHFYMISMAERQQIAPNDPRGENNPAPIYFPAGYIGPPGTVPMMGKHWVDPTSAEFQPGGVFTKTFIYGSFDGSVTFLEPMFTLKYLQGTENSTSPIPQPAAVQRTGKYYPTKYIFKHDMANHEYVIMLTDMVLR